MVMGSARSRVISLLLVAAFVMMIIGPLASLFTWLFGLVIALILVPLLVYLAMGHSKRRTEESGGELFTWRGLRPDEWAEENDPDDFEGEED